MSMEHLRQTDVKTDIPTDMSRDELRHWAYQLYIKDYLRCIAGIDENVGRILNYLDEQGLAENTVVIYTGDQGFFLGEHGWFDKRLMYEECLRMPFVIRYPKEIKPGTDNKDITLNIDFAPLFLDYAGMDKPSQMQGESFRSNLRNETGTKNESRTPEWELYDLKEDPMEMKNLYHDPSKKALIKELKTKLLELKQQYDDEDSKYPTMAEIARKYYW